MNSKIISVALLAASAAAGANKTDEFLSYEGQFSKSYRTVTEQAQAYKNFMEADKIIERVNEKAKIDKNPDAATAGHNFLSDLSHDERLKYLTRGGEGAGRMPPIQEGFSLQRKSGRKSANTPVDHYKDGFMHPVKNQKGCGSCYAFGATTALEGQIMKLKNEQNRDAHFRLSEQEAVECSDDYKNQRCLGGLEYNVWDYIRDQPVADDSRRRGIMTDQEYPYTGKDSGNCQRDQVANPHVKSYGITGWQRAAQNVDAIKAAVQDKPVAIGIYAGCEAFMFYRQGIITAAECPETGMDHSVVVVGWYANSHNNGDSTTDPVDPVEPCYNTKWYSNCPTDGGDGGDNNDGVDLDMAYWLIQNSWGTGWGEDGFARIEMAPDTGVGCFNCDVTWPTIDPTLIDLDPASQQP